MNPILVAIYIQELPQNLFNCRHDDMGIQVVRAANANKADKSFPRFFAKDVPGFSKKLVRKYFEGAEGMQGPGGFNRTQL